MKMGKRRLTCLLAAIMMTLFAACGAAQGGAAQNAGSGETQEAASATKEAESAAMETDSVAQEAPNANETQEADSAAMETDSAAQEAADSATQEATASAAQEATSTSEKQEATATAAQEKNGDVVILYTSDIHCGVEKGFGLVGLQQVRETLEAKGYTTILVDDGDAVQGERRVREVMVGGEDYDSGVGWLGWRCADARAGRRVIDGLEMREQDGGYRYFGRYPV